MFLYRETLNVCGPLKVSDFQITTKEIVRRVQQQVLAKEFEVIKAEGKVLRGSGYLSSLTTQA